ncbi:MAG: response regulator, partial [Verrucomicrobiota bacterium]
SCVLADMTLLGMSGLELKQVLNATHSQLPVIFLTAHDTTEMRAAAREVGATGYFRKPVDTKLLIDAIQWTIASHPPVRAA